MKITEKLTDIKEQIVPSNRQTLNGKKDEPENMKQSYYKNGFEDSKNALGNPSIFESCLEYIYEKYKEKCRTDEIEQKKLKEPYVEQREKLNTELKKKEAKLSLRNEELEKCESEIKEIDKTVANVKSSPENYGVDASGKPKVHFYVGLVVLIPITIFLISFYISATYSAFFKNFNNPELQSAIFDAQALNLAVKEGWLEAVFISTIPFAFMGLGYLIHMFLREKGWGYLKVGVLLITTFIFDSILAYLIENKIYQFERTPMSPDFNLELAFQRIEFWGIIFSGYVVYIIWGLVFDFIMKEHENQDKIKMFIRTQKETKSNIKKQIASITKQIEHLTSEIVSLKGRISEIQTKINGFIFPSQTYLLIHSEYEKGWLLAINKEFTLPFKEKQELIYNCKKVSTEHLTKHLILNKDVENITYFNKENHDD